MSDFSVDTMSCTGSYYFTNKTGNSNKWWRVQFLGGNRVRYTFARIGLACSRPTDKSFPGSYQMEREVKKKIREKLAEGYQFTQEEALTKETQVAQTLGTQYKILNVYYVTEVGPRSMKLGDAAFYQPEKGIVAHVLQSWTGEETWIWLNKSDSQQLVHPVLEGTGGTYESITFNRTSVPQSNFVHGVREFLRQASRKVKQFISTFAQTGRVLFGGHDEDDEAAVQELAKDTPGVNKSLLSSFASLGDRVLEI